MKRVDIEKLTAPRRLAAMHWIANHLETVAKSLSVSITASYWQLQGTESDTIAYQFIAIGRRDRRVTKLFTLDELDRCLDDEELQAEIHSRLTRLVTFLGGRPTKLRVSQGSDE